MRLPPTCALSTCRSARTLAYYLSETNLNLYHWLLAFIRQNPIPRVRSCTAHDFCTVCTACPLMRQHDSLLDVCAADDAVTLLTIVAQTGAWDDVSGETFLRTLLSMPIQAAKFRTVQ